MKLGVYLAILSATACCSAFAEEPQPAAAQPAVVQSAEIQPAAAASSAAPTADTKLAKSEKSDLTDAQIKQMRGRGYKPVKQHDGTLTFCRSETQIGSHFPATHCNTFDELNRMELNAKYYTSTMQQQASPTQFKGP